jgi:ubiquitin C-terminal hydrolase
VVAPHTLKAHLGRFAPRFLGYSQQDSQELLSYLLDALHEDLNEKDAWATLPPVDEARWEAASLERKSAWARERHALRHSSVIEDLFGGWLRSTLTCTQCGKASVKFDPYQGLSLPFPPGAKTARSVSLNDCLRSFFCTEVRQNVGDGHCVCGAHSALLSLWMGGDVVARAEARQAALLKIAS